MSNHTNKQQHELLPIFDTAEYLGTNQILPEHLRNFIQFESDYSAARAFLYAYKNNKATFNAYRREVERLLHWAWQVVQKSIFELRRADIELYITFCQNPPKQWIGLSKPPRFTSIDGIRQPNPNWRPFVATTKKAAAREGENPNKNDYGLSEKATREIFAVLSTFYHFLIQDEHTDINPISQVRQKSKYIRKSQDKKTVRRLSDLQWSFVIETAETMANKKKYHERTLFIMSALYLMYLRISELVINDRWEPKMSDFKRDHDGLWWFTTVGKGNKERQIAVSSAMLSALKRWRQHLGLQDLPSLDEQYPLITKERGKGGMASTNQIRNLVQSCFDLAAERMIKEGLEEEVGSLRSATVHWLRHTGISDDVKRRPREHVRDDAGHSSSQTTDRYINIELRDRHKTAKDKPVKYE